MVPSFLFMLGPRSQPGSYRPRELIFPILSCGVLLQIRSGSLVSLSMLKGFSGLALAMARRVLLVLGLVSWFTCTLTSLLQSLWSSLSPSLLRALLVQLAEDVMQFKLLGLAWRWSTIKQDIGNLYTYGDGPNKLLDVILEHGRDEELLEVIILKVLDN